MWKPWNAFIFDNITDFDSTLRAEASMPGAHFKWPEQRMTYDMVIAQAMHHLPPGYHVSIKSGNPCPKELLISTPEWHGEAAQYYHGTTTHSLLRGIIRDGLKPTFGAGGDTTARAWGQNTPVVYVSKLLECACFYPSHDATHAMDPYKNYGVPWGGEVISRAGTPPIRVVLRCISMNTKQLWHKHHKLNDHRGFMPKHVYISHIMICALPPFMASASHSHTTWQMYTPNGHVATWDNLMADESSSDKGMRNGKEQWLVPEVYGIGRVMEQPLNLNTTKKDMLATRINHRQAAIIKKWVHVPRDPEARKVMVTDDLSEKVRHLLDMSPEHDVVPVLEHATSLKNRGKSRYHSDDNIMKILANHQLGNSVDELPTQENQPEETKTD